MANTATMYTFEITLSDSDRDVYEELKITVAMHPSESVEFMATRVLAFCLEYEQDLSFTKGLAEPDEPALWAKAPDGRITKWIEIGVPDPQRLHKAAKIADYICVYSHRSPANLLKQAAATRVHRGSEIRVVSFGAGVLEGFCQRLDRRNPVSVSVGGQHLYLTIGGTTVEGEVIVVPLVAE